MMALLKFIHLGAIALWAAGFLVMPLLLTQRQAGLNGEPLHRLHRLTRQLYVGWMSPAAAVAIASGTVLILMRQTYLPWFSAKMLAVGLMAALHVGQGLMIPRVFGGRMALPRWLAGTLMAVHMAVVLAVLALVLAKPNWRVHDQPWPALTEPGALAKRWEDALTPALDAARRALGAPAP